MHIGELRPWVGVDELEQAAAMHAVKRGMSGYLGGQLRSSGYWINRLEQEWAERFQVKHAIACNSATSGLLAACAAINIGPGDQVLVPTMTMSATAAAPKFLGAEITFGDVDHRNFCLDFPLKDGFKAIIIVNLFGHPALLHFWRSLADEMGSILIEDNAQSPLATENERYAGTIGHIGVFSLNYHKHIQAGEGGIVVTNDDDLSDKVRLFINHHELYRGGRKALYCKRIPGLNMRMTEVTAAIACSQLVKADQLIANRVEQAEAIVSSIGTIPSLKTPFVRDRCHHVYYVVPFLVENDRKYIVQALNDAGFPVSAGYQPIHQLPAFKRGQAVCPTAVIADKKRLFYFENCAWSLTTEQICRVGDFFREIMEEAVPQCA